MAVGYVDVEAKGGQLNSPRSMYGRTTDNSDPHGLQ